VVISPPAGSTAHINPPLRHIAEMSQPAGAIFQRVGGGKK